jgi:hypothetical protein
LAHALNKILPASPQHTQIVVCFSLRDWFAWLSTSIDSPKPILR